MGRANNKILFIVPQGSQPGAMQFVYRLVKSLRENGLEIELLTVRTSFLPHIFIKQAMRIRRETTSQKFEGVVAQYGTYTGLITTLFSRLPVIVTFRGSDLNYVPSENIFKWVIQNMASQIAAARSSGIVCVSRKLSKKLWLGKNRKLAIIPSNIDLENFLPKRQDKCRKILGWDPIEPVCIFFSGSNHRVKRLDLAREIEARLQKNGSPVKFMIFDHINSDMLSIVMNAADCMVFLSDHEGSPNIIKEACACNLPIISVDVGDVSDVLKDVDNCCIVPRDISIISECVERLSSLKTRTNGINQSELYSATRIAKLTIDFYVDIFKIKTFI